MADATLVIETIFFRPPASGHAQMPSLRNVRRAWREAGTGALCCTKGGKALHELGHSVVRERGQMVGVAKRAFAHVAVVAVCQESPDARVTPLVVCIRLREPAHRVDDNNIRGGFQGHGVSRTVETPFELPPPKQLQEELPVALDIIFAATQCRAVRDWRARPAENKYPQGLRR